MEFPVVFNRHMEEGIFPHSRSLFEKEEMEEERRLAYVGITRAEQRLYLSCAKLRTLFGKTNANPQSRFIKEIPSEICESLNEEKIEPAWAKTSRSLNGSSNPTVQRPKANLISRPQMTTTGGDQFTWQVGDKAEHKKWGIGTVVSMRGAGENVELDIAFPQPIGIKRLAAKFAPITKVI
ncbi:hypothetical protein KHA80_08365 [Anaerobacillus sp. HL2]|nr:hypothetical protein KHA80_08365 [Anaerobacillus sp. HL2]